MANVDIKSLMNVAGINTFIKYQQNNPNKNISRRVFLEALAYDLINPQLRRRIFISSLPRSIRLRLTEICKLDGPENAATSNNNKVGRCGYCYSKKTARHVTTVLPAKIFVELSLPFFKQLSLKNFLNHCVF